MINLLVIRIYFNGLKLSSKNDENVTVTITTTKKLEEKERN